MTVYLHPDYRPRPRIAVAAWMVALHHKAGAAQAREAWMAELLGLACAITRRTWS